MAGALQKTRTRTTRGDEMKFHGQSYDAKQDYQRLAGQMKTIFEIMRDGVWRTTQELATLLNTPNQASCEANLRNLRKPENGGHMILRKNRNNVRGCSEYRLMVHRESMKREIVPMETEQTPEQYREECRKRMEDLFR